MEGKNRPRPRWEELSSGSPALKAMCDQWDTTGVRGGACRNV